jgi:hypothetical protein
MAYFLESFLALMFHNGLVTRLNHPKNPAKQKKRVEIRLSKLNIPCMAEKTVKIIKESPPKQALITRVSLKLIML